MLKEKLGLGAPPAPSLLQVVDALILCDDPVLDQRFAEAVAMHPDAAVRAALKGLPARVAEGSRLTRRAGVEWERATGSTVLDDEFRERAERFLLEALLDSAESQIRLKSFMAAHAPTREVRRLIDGALDIHYELTTALRTGLEKLGHKPQAAEDAAPLGHEAEARNLRAQVEAAIRALCDRGTQARTVVVSANALRHLRDEGALADGSTTILGVPVQVDMSWRGAGYAVLSYESIPLEEMTRQE